MLVLTRKTNQSIMIGDDIEVTVLAVAKDKIRLGITAPREVPVFRKEVYLSIKGEGADVGRRRLRRWARPSTSSRRASPGSERHARVSVS